MKIKVNFWGRFPVKSRKFVQRTMLSRVVSIKGYVSYEKSIEEQLKSNLLLLITGYTSRSEGEVTGKIYEYFGAKKPILALTCKDSLAGEIIGKTNTGKVVLGNDVKEIAQAILKFYQEFYENGGEISYRPNIEEVEKYNYKNIIQELNLVLNNLCAE